MPFYIYFASLNLDLSQTPIDKASLEKALRKIFSANTSEVTLLEENIDLAAFSGESPEQLNKQLWALIEEESNIVDEELKTALNNHIALFDEKTWVLFHLLCERCTSDYRLSFFSKIIHWIKDNSASEKAMQARLFLMSQTDFEVNFEDDEYLAPHIVKSNDPWAVFALLSHPEFNILFPREGLRAAINQALLNSACVSCQNEGKKDDSQSLLWVFLRSSNISSEQKKKLLSNIASLDFTEEQVMQWPVEVLSTLVSLSNDVTDGSNLAFRANLFRTYIFKVPTELSSKQQEEIDRKSLKYSWTPDQIKNAKLVVLQGIYFVVVDKFLSLIVVKDYLDAIPNKSELTDKLNFIMGLKVFDENKKEEEFNVINRFSGKIFPVLWGANLDSPKHISEDSLNWLLDLAVFKNYFNYPLTKAAKARAINDFYAILQVPDNPPFVEKFFAPKGFYSNDELHWELFPADYFSAMLMAIIKYVALLKADNKFTNNLKVRQIIELDYIFSDERRKEELHNIRVELFHEPVFYYALKNHYADVLIRELDKLNIQNHSGILNPLIPSNTEDNSSQKEMVDSEAETAREKAQKRIDIIFKISKQAFVSASESAKELKDSLIFKRLALHYRAGKYKIDRNSKSWEVAQYTCLRYIDKNLATLMSAEAGTSSQRKAPFLWPVYVECGLLETVSVREKEWTSDKEPQFRDWVSDVLFCVSTHRGSMFVSGGADPRKFAETLLFYVLSAHSRRKFFEKIGRDLREKFFKLANFELAPQEFQAELDEYKINPQLVNNFTEKLGEDIDALKQMFDGYVNLYVDAFSKIRAAIALESIEKEKYFFTIVTRLDDYSKIERKELEEILTVLPIESYYLSSSQAFKDLEFPQIIQIKELECLFNQETTEWSKVRTPHHSETFVRALKNHYALRLAEDLSNENLTSAARIKKISQLVKSLPVENQKELYKDINYIILRFKNRFMKYTYQHENYSATESERKMKKMKFLDWIIKNMSRIEAGAFASYPNGPMGAAYNILEHRNHDPVLIDTWLREVIFYNNPWAQAIGHGLGLLGANVNNGKKGSKLAETMMLLPEASIEKILYGSKFSYKNLFEKANPGRDFAEHQIIRDQKMASDIKNDEFSRKSNVSSPFPLPDTTYRNHSLSQAPTPGRQSSSSDSAYQSIREYSENDDVIPKESRRKDYEGWSFAADDRVAEVATTARNIAEESVTTVVARFQPGRG